MPHFLHRHIIKWGGEMLTWIFRILELCKANAQLYQFAARNWQRSATGLAIARLPVSLSFACGLMGWSPDLRRFFSDYLSFFGKFSGLCLRIRALPAFLMRLRPITEISSLAAANRNPPPQLTQGGEPVPVPGPAPKFLLFVYRGALVSNSR